MLQVTHCKIQFKILKLFEIKFLLLNFINVVLFVNLIYMYKQKLIKLIDDL